jgi:histone acetyltransferase (RNA polymerase elongator complex component)
VALGVEPEEAETLVREYGWNLVVRQLEHYHWAVAGGKEIQSPRSWIKSAIRFKSGEGYRIPPALEKEIAAAYRETERWCTDIYRSLTDEEQAEINETVLATLPPEIRARLTQKEPEARRTFLRERNRLVLDRLSRTTERTS